jgi:acetylornithine deacetylase/succinyl-diaminopimelate desuccinylase-like protein
VKYSSLDKSYPEIKWNDKTEEATKILSDLLKINTVRGNEIEAVKYIQTILNKEGIKSTLLFDPNFPKRPNLIAELPATTPNPKPGIILANHLDTVEFDPKEWKIPPTSGSIIDGRIYGRGAIDMKGMAVMELMAFLEIKRSGVLRNRKIMFLSLADEESGSKLGGLYLTTKHPEVFNGYEYALNEGGVATRDIVIPKSTIFNIQYSEKGNIWIRAKAKGTSGHGSTPPKEYAILTLIKFFEEVRKIDSDIEITTETESFFYQLGTISNFPNSFFLKNAKNPIIKILLSGTISNNRHLSAMTTNTKSITGIKTTEGEEGENVISGEAFGKMDIRTLPGVNQENLIQKIDKIANKYSVEITITDKNSADSSSIETEFFQTLASVSVSKFSNSTVTPFLSPGKTDNSYLRRIGIKSYGLIPAILYSEDIDTMHGKNENISIENLRLGSNIIFETLIEMFSKKK